jgi:leucyl-tRNA synthetase
MINNYGADAVRLFILSDSPPEKDVQWSDQGMLASYKFVQKFWSLHKKILEHKNDKTDFFNESLELFTNQVLNKINLNLNKFSYNVIVANLHEIYNFFTKMIEKKTLDKNLIDNYTKVLIMMIPITPHLASECLKEMGNNEEISWPKIDNKYLENKKNTIVVQINGKKRSLIVTENSVEENNLIQIINEKQDLKKFINDKKIIKSIYIKNKLINLIIE